MTPGDFEYIRKAVKECSGLVLNDDKHYLVHSRLAPLARKRGIGDVSELIAKLKNGGDKQLIEDVVEAMTTNESYFFRDTYPFDQLRNAILPELIEARQSSRRLRIWCAACSTGQEPYSVAIVLKEQAAKLNGWSIDIVATDLSNEVLNKAKAGRYSQFEVQRGLPIQMLVKYFEEADDTWQITSTLRDMVTFKPLNLLHDFSHLGKFDIVFCRNVLIYFDRDTKEQVFDRLAGVTASDGYVFLGGAETVIGITDKIVPLKGHRGAYVLASNTVSQGASNVSATSSAVA